MISQSRRAFLIKSGWTTGGLTVLSACSVIPPLPTFGESDSDDIVTWVQLTTNGTVRFNLPRAEMGQGISTGLSQVVAEELNLSLDRIDCQYQSTQAMAPCQMTVGSQSIENYLSLTAQAAAALRTTLAKRAATRLSVSTADLQLIEGGFKSATGKTVSYTDLVRDHGSVIEIDANQFTELLSERPIDQLRVIGKTVTQVNIDQIVTGQEIYSRDKQLDGLTFGAIARPPQLGATFSGFDDSKARQVAGVIQIIEWDGQIGVVAQTPMAASAALAALDIDWEPLSTDQVATAQQLFDVDTAITAQSLDHTLIDEGSLEQGYQSAVQKLSLRYDSPMAAHAAMEPRSGVASYQTTDSGADICEIWTGSQDPWLVQSAVAKKLGVSRDLIKVHNQRIGGGFGGRVLCQASVEAAWLSMQVKRPVKVQWSREEEFAHNYVGPQFSSRIDAGLDKDGNISYWHHRAVGAPILISSAFFPSSLHWIADLIPDPGTRRGLALPYAIANSCVEYADVRVPMPTGPWRGLGAAPNGFSVECAMDELASAAGADPIEFRIRHTNRPRLTAVLTRLGEILGDELSGVGIASAIYKDVTYIAVAARVVLEGGKPVVKKLWCVHDCGKVIAPDQVRAQIEGNLVWGIGMALHERFELKNALAATTNFDRYQLARNSDTPPMQIELIASDLAPSGAAEAAFAPAAAAIVNGVFRSTGKRYRQLPIEL